MGSIENTAQESFVQFNEADVATLCSTLKMMGKLCEKNSIISLIDNLIKLRYHNLCDHSSPQTGTRETRLEHAIYRWSQVDRETRQD